MKTKLPTNRAGVAVAALLASIGLSTSAKAITLAYESAGPWGPIGTPYLGPVQFKFVAFDNGTQYAVPTPAIGYSGPGGPANAALITAGITAVNAVPGQIPAGFANLGTNPAGGNEDLWGIARVTNIQTPAGVDVWTPLGKGTELTGFLHGEQDFHIQADPSNPLNASVESGAGLRVDIWEDGTPGGTVDPTTPFDPTGGPVAHPLNSYPSVTDGTLQLQLGSTFGFIHTDVVGPSPGFGGSATEYENSFNPGSLSGLGTSFLNVIGGAQAAMFDTNSIASLSSLFNGVANADFKANFTINPGQFGFLVTANDPLVGLAVPEPSTVLAGFACLLPMLRRNRSRKAI